MNLDVRVESVRRWMRQADIDDGVRDGLTTSGNPSSSGCVATSASQTRSRVLEFDEESEDGGRGTTTLSTQPASWSKPNGPSLHQTQGDSPG